ncbi:MAG: hypothetical protein K2M00_00370 [Muribaculaceae bacterium]|nr:hypothetical protein [Muribaculaceae bacterium]
MSTKATLPKDFCSLEAVRYVASRYGTTPEKILERFLVQTGAIDSDKAAVKTNYQLTPNEIALFSDLGVKTILEEIRPE